jgi:prefoldin subunit 5
MIRKYLYGAIGLVERELAQFARIIDRLDAALEHLYAELGVVNEEREELRKREDALRAAQARAGSVRAKLAALISA